MIKINMLNLKNLFKISFDENEYNNYYVMCKNNNIPDLNIDFQYLFTINKSYKVIKVTDYGYDYGKSYIILNDDNEEMPMNDVLFERLFIDLQTYRNDKLEKLGI